MISGLRSQYNISKISYIFCNKRIMAFLERQMSKDRAGKIRFSVTRKSVLLKASSGERFAPRNFVLLVMLGGTSFHLIVWLAVHQIK